MTLPKLIAILLLAALACGPAHEKPVVAPWQPPVAVKTAETGEKPDDPGAPAGTDASTAILSREPVTSHAKVKHVLVGWAALAPTYHGQMDPRAAKRSQTDAQKLAREILARVNKGEPIEKLMADLSEDPGSASSGEAYEVAPDAQLVPEFIQLGLRLHVGEAGIVETQFGYHIIKRVE